jgi:outer membrane protein OmpA-like peptidoglycan-associated protein
LTLDGTVFGGSETNEQPLDATLTVYLNSDFIKKDSVVVVNGQYSESFTDFGWYIIDFSAPGYADARDTIWVMNTHRKNIHKDYHLVPLDSKLSITLTNIHFKSSSSTLEPDAYVELNYLSDFLNHNSNKQVNVSGHTDNTGPSEYNQLLSHARAQSVIKYLISKGVRNDQVVAIAYGDRNPADSNTTPVGKANNRRVELVLSDKLVESEINISNINGIHFDFGTANLRPGSYEELDRLAKFFISNVSKRVEVAGHTDSSGPEDYNNFLSRARAQAVVDYLTSKGVSGDQLFAKGYGEARPIDTNATAAGKANNRRVELVLLTTSNEVQLSVKN